MTGRSRPPQYAPDPRALLRGELLPLDRHGLADARSCRGDLDNGTGHWQGYSEHRVANEQTHRYTQTLDTSPYRCNPRRSSQWSTDNRRTPGDRYLRIQPRQQTERLGGATETECSPCPWHVVVGEHLQAASLPNQPALHSQRPSEPHVPCSAHVTHAHDEHLRMLWTRGRMPGKCHWCTYRRTPSSSRDSPLQTSP
jgi:hypothetical protein